MQKIKRIMPLTFLPGARAKKVSPLQRLFAILFGSPNARRAHGIIYSGFDVFGAVKRVYRRLRRSSVAMPVYEIDRIGTIYEEKLPRIWLSEEVFNTRFDDGNRIFVECYPAGPDAGGEKALELGDRYLAEGYKNRKKATASGSMECFQAAEILYMHSVRRGNRIAAHRLKEMYSQDLCKGQWYETYLCTRAKHALKHTSGPRRCA